MNMEICSNLIQESRTAYSNTLDLNITIISYEVLSPPQKYLEAKNNNAQVYEDNVTTK